VSSAKIHGMTSRRPVLFVYGGRLLNVNSTEHGKNECLQQADQELQKVEWEGNRISEIQFRGVARRLRSNPWCEEAFHRHKCCRTVERRVIKAGSRSKPSQLRQQTEITEAALTKELPSDPFGSEVAFQDSENANFLDRPKYPPTHEIERHP
jgi:hypothetical protein